MRTVDLSEARAMFREILATESADSRTVGMALALGTWPLAPEVKGGFGDLDEVFVTFSIAAKEAKGGKIVVDDGAWARLEDVYYEKVTKQLFA